MFCSISGSVPEEPVVSKVNGQLYERRLAEKHIQETGKDPISGENSTLDDLLPVKTNRAVKPRPSPATSIPGLLGLFHNEWDALMLETHTLRQNLNTVRQELSHALYQHDAACRVIARLVKERDEARQLLTDYERLPAPVAEATAIGAAKRPAAVEEAEEPAPAKRAKAGITKEIVDAMTAKNVELSKGRKKRAVSESLATVEDIAAMELLTTNPLHKTTQGGINAIEFCPGDSNIIATAGSDGTVQLFDRSAARILSTLSGHTKKVTDVAFMGSRDVLVSTSADKTARVWTAGEGGGYSCAATLKEHSGDVVAVSLHPTGDYFVTASADKTWAFYDLETALCLSQVADPAVEAGYTCAKFHPDGLILGTGTAESLVRIWEVRQQKNVAKFEGHTGAVTSLSFSENGYYLATAAADSVKLWDLRRLKNFHTIVAYDSAPVTSVAFDFSGLYLGVTGPDARIYGVKQDWGVLKTFDDMPKRGAFDLAFGSDAKTVLVGAADHNLRTYGLPA